MDQPRWDDDAVTWRRFAGDLRQRMGEAKRRVEDAERRAADAEARAAAAVAETAPGLRDQLAAAERKIAGLWERSERHRSAFQVLMRQKLRDGRTLNRLERLLHEGDIAAAVDVLAARRAAIERATGGDEVGPDANVGAEC